MNKIIFDKVSLTFGTQEIFSNFSAEFAGGKIFGISGQNGAGKSTLLKLAGKILKPDSGKINFSTDLKIAAVTPEMKIYEALTVEENLKFFAKLRNKNLSTENIFELSRRVGLNLEKFLKVQVANFSTGMKQRLKFAILLSVEAEIWLLDEPTSNLDFEGKKIFHTEIQRGAKFDKIILLASNDSVDLEICDEVINLPLHKKS